MRIIARLIARFRAWDRRLTTCPECNRRIGTNRDCAKCVEFKLEGSAW